MAKKIITQKDEIIPHSYLKSHIATSRLEAPRPIEQMIYTLRDVQVILDEDIAGLYGVKTKRLNEQVKRNIERFESDFMFKLTAEEFAILKSQNAISSWGGRRSLPFAFTELGVAMLSSVLTSKEAIEVNKKIMRAFSAMRRFLVSNAQVFQRLDNLEYKLIATDEKVALLYDKIEEGKLEPRQGIFFDGQIYDAYEFICGLIKNAKTRIVLIDNYVDDTVLTMLDKREAGVLATIYTQKISSQFQLDITKHNAQYPAIDVKEFTKSHDRFLILDNQVYLIGASLKDLGKKWFAVSLMSETDPELLLSRL
ncbi:MAG: ORF6N domain-containing protein [Bacteroidales bacterium]|nr:ORF6N domain-containing protein [Bacteroidales bacterium]